MSQADKGLRLLATQALAPWQAGVFFLVAMLFYSTPLLINNYPYIDDSIRSLVSDTLWREEGRLVGNYLMHALTFSGAAPDVFPLTLFAGIFAMAYGMTSLARHWFERPTLAQCAILLPLWYNPFYLQVMSYHYDCFTVSVGIAFISVAIPLAHRGGFWRTAAAAALVAAAMSTHQVTVNVVIGLACVDLLQALHKQLRTRDAGWLTVRHAVALAGALLLYRCTSYTAITRDRGGVIWPTLEQWHARADLIASKVLLFVTPANTVVFLALALAAMGGLGILLARAWRAGEPAATRLLRIGLCLASVAGLIASVGGVLLLLYNLESNLGARVLMGVGPLLIGLLLLAHVCLARVRLALVGWLYVPLACCLSFAFAYGQVMADKKDLEGFTRTLLASDLLNNPQINAAREFVILRDPNGPLFSPVCVHAALPAMDYIFGNHYLMLPEQLFKWGLGKVRLKYRYEVPELRTPVLERPFYKIYLEQGVAYVRFVPFTTHFACRFP